MSLDSIDRKLLYHLDQNCRISATQLAKQLQIHRNVVLYRIKRLEDLKIIKGYFAEINTMKLGYTTFRLLITLSNYSSEDEEKLIKYLFNTPQLIWFFKTEGKYDVDIVYVSKNIIKFNSFIEDFHKNFNRILEDEKISILTQIIYYQKDYLINKKRKQVFSKKFNNEVIPIDKTDEKILNLLSKNAKINIIDLAKQTSLSINTVKARKKALEKNGIILGYRPFIDTEKTGYIYYKLYLKLKNYTSEEYAQINSFFIFKNSTIYSTKYINGEDIEIEMHLENENKFQELKNELISKYGRIIKEIYTLKFSKEYIFRYLPTN